MMRGSWHGLLATTLMIVAAAVRLHSQGGPKRVKELSIELKPVRDRVLVQESLPVITSLVNRGSAVITAPAADGPSPFVYELRPTQDGQGVRLVSEQRALEATTPGTPQPSDPLPFNIGPGGSVPRRDDLAAMAVKPFAPGTYSVTVQTNVPAPIGPSAPASVQIVAPRLVAAASNVDAFFDRPFAFIHAEDNGAFPILAQHGDASKAESIVFQRAATEERWPKPDSVAVSVPTGSEAKTHWVAWTAGGTLLATKDWGPSRTHTLLRATLPGPAARLLSPGYFFADDSGLFMALDGATLHAYRVTETALVRTWSATLAGKPERALLRYAGGARADGVIQLTTVSGQGGRSRLSMQAWSVKDGRETLPHQVISDLFYPVLAWSIPATGKGRPVRLHVISGPSPDGRSACLAYQLEKNTVRIPAQPVPAPPEPVQQWALTVAGNGKVVVTARSSRKVFAITLPNTAWQTLAGDTSAEGFFDVFANHDRAWAEWFDPRFGFRYAGLRAE